jgi:AcrR family transcriptional regulator
MTTTETPETTTRRGRPRSAASEQAILAASLDLINEGHSPASISIGAIARRAGAGKDTIYRRWPCKEDLLLDALAAQNRPLDIPLDVPIREALIVPLAALIERFQSDRNRRILRSLYGAGDEFPKLRARYQEQVVTPRRDRVRARVRAAVERGEIVADGNPAETALMPFSAVVLAALEEHPIQGNPRRAAARMVDSVLRGIAVAPAPH